MRKVRLGVLLLTVLTQQANKQTRPQSSGAVSAVLSTSKYAGTLDQFSLRSPLRVLVVSGESARSTERFGQKHAVNSIVAGVHYRCVRLYAGLRTSFSSVGQYTQPNVQVSSG